MPRTASRLREAAAAPGARGARHPPLRRSLSTRSRGALPRVLQITFKGAGRTAGAGPSSGKTLANRNSELAADAEPWSGGKVGRLGGASAGVPPASPPAGSPGTTAEAGLPERARTRSRGAAGASSDREEQCRSKPIPTYRTSPPRWPPAPRLRGGGLTAPAARDPRLSLPSRPRRSSGTVTTEVGGALPPSDGSHRDRLESSGARWWPCAPRKGHFGPSHRPPETLVGPERPAGFRWLPSRRHPVVGTSAAPPPPRYQALAGSSPLGRSRSCHPRVPLGEGWKRPAGSNGAGGAAHSPAPASPAPASLRHCSQQRKHVTVPAKTLNVIDPWPIGCHLPQGVLPHN
ncbi:uncharacterized protein [Castor canadensis]|uniref:Uncharacterized protein n=1 Tax=Castor canadensis TaxID=51338 RepID=A0AC58MPK8_CASCN